MVGLAPEIRVCDARNPQDRMFDDMGSVAGFLVRRLSSCWHIQRAIQGDIHIELVGTYGGPQKVRLATDDGLVEVPRDIGNGEGVIVSASPENNKIMSVNIRGERSDPSSEKDVFRSGMVWANVGAGQLTFMSVTLLPEHGLEDEVVLRERIESMFEKGVSFLNGLLESGIPA